MAILNLQVFFIYKGRSELAKKMEKFGVKGRRERNQRLYNQLPEVCRKKMEQKRTATYKSNRERASRL